MSEKQFNKLLNTIKVGLSLVISILLLILDTGSSNVIYILCFPASMLIVYGWSWLINMEWN